MMIAFVVMGCGLLLAALGFLLEDMDRWEKEEKRKRELEIGKTGF